MTDLERIAAAAREYIQRRANDPRPQTWYEAREALRKALGEPEPEPPLVKPWDA